MLYKLIQEYDQMFGEKTGGILQSLDELEQLVDEMGDRKFHSMAEIGSYRGGTLWLYSQLFAADKEQADKHRKFIFGKAMYGRTRQDNLSLYLVGQAS